MFDRILNTPLEGVLNIHLVSLLFTLNIRAAFRTQTNIKVEAFYQIVNGCKLVAFFTKSWNTPHITCFCRLVSFNICLYISSRDDTFEN